MFFGRHCIVLLLALAAGGCGFTPAIWHQAGQTRLHTAQVVGSVPPGRSASAPGGALILAYHAAGQWAVEDRRVLVLVPLAVDGGPPERFRIDRPTRDALTIHETLPRARRAAIRGVRFDSAAFRQGRRLRNSRLFLPLDARGGVSTHSNSSMHLPGGVQLVAYWPAGLPAGADGTVVRSRTRQYPPGSWVMLLPASQPRPCTDRAWNVMEAMLLTPVALAADAVVVPVGFVIWSAYGLQGA